MPRPLRLAAVAASTFLVHHATALGAQTPAAPPAGPPAGPPERVDSAEFRRRLDAAVDSLAANDWFAGSILVTRDGRPLYARAVGLADRERQVPNRLETRYDVASMNKMMTAVAVLQLARDGKVALDAPVGRYLPDYPNVTVRDRVTLAQLLSHTGGLGSYWNDRYRERRARVRTVDDYLALFAADPLPSTPGAQWEYSNAGFIVLGAIVERVTGETYDAYVQRRIFAPSGMTGSGFWPLDEQVPDRAVSYTTGERPGPMRPGMLAGHAPARTSAMDGRPQRGGPAGGGYSTVVDLTRFADALRARTLLPKAWTDSLWAPHATRPERMGGNAYGYGFGVERSPIGTVVGHGGGQPGSGGQLDIFLDRGYTVAILTNVDPLGAMRLDATVRRLLAGLTTER